MRRMLVLLITAALLMALPAKAIGPGETLVVVSAACPMRAEAKGETAPLPWLTWGDRVTLNGVAGEYAAVRFGARHGYVPAEALAPLCRVMKLDGFDASPVSLYAEPSRGSAVVTSFYEPGNQALFVGAGPDGFACVSVNGQEGWLPAKYLKPMLWPRGHLCRVLPDAVPLYLSCDAASPALATLPRDAVVTGFDSIGDWEYVRWGGLWGFVELDSLVQRGYDFDGEIAPMPEGAPYAIDTRPAAWSGEALARRFWPEGGYSIDVSELFSFYTWPGDAREGGIWQSLTVGNDYVMFQDDGIDFGHRNASYASAAKTAREAVNHFFPEVDTSHPEPCFGQYDEDGREIEDHCEIIFEQLTEYGVAAPGRCAVSVDSRQVSSIWVYWPEVAAADARPRDTISGEAALERLRTAAASVPVWENGESTFSNGGDTVRRVYPAYAAFDRNDGRCTLAWAIEIQREKDGGLFTAYVDAATGAVYEEHDGWIAR